jgi:hypothetical protein
MHRFGSFLLSQAKYDAAGLIFDRAGLFEEAVDAFSKSLSWRDALSAASRVPFDDERMRELGEELAGERRTYPRFGGVETNAHLCRRSEELSQEGRFEEAAIVHREVLQDSRAAVDMLIKAALWAEAIRVVSLTLVRHFTASDMCHLPRLQLHNLVRWWRPISNLLFWKVRRCAFDRTVFSNLLAPVCSIRRRVWPQRTRGATSKV